MPKIWLARDELGVSKQEVEEIKKAGLEASDDGAWFDEKGKIQWCQDGLRKAPVWEERVEY